MKLWSVSTEDSSGEVDQIWAATKAAALKEARRLYGTPSRLQQLYGNKRVVVYVKQLPSGGLRPNPRRKNPTKAQKREKVRKLSVKRRVAIALAKFLKQANPGMKTAGASIQKLKGGVLKITPIKANAGRSTLYSVSTADSSGEVGQIWAKTKAEALKEARRLYGKPSRLQSLYGNKTVPVYVRKLYGG